MLGRLMRSVFFHLVALLALLATPSAATAHGAASPSLVVSVDHVDPGASLPILAADFGSDSRVLFELVGSAKSQELGHWTAGPDGHFTARFDIPRDFPVGWADVVATGDDGSSTSAQVLVGPVAGAAPRPGRASAWWQDPAALLLAGLLLVGAIGLSVVLIRSSRRAEPRKRRT